MKKTNKWIVSLLVIIGLIVCTVGGVVASNFRVVLEKQDYYSDHLPVEFYGYRILCIADFHDSFYFDQVAKIANDEKPDCVLFLGDMTELAHKNWDNTLRLLDEIDESIPVYGVLGNHEVLSPNIEAITADLEAHGMYLLNNEKIQLSKGDASISLIGLNDIADDDSELGNSWLLEQSRLYLETAIDPEAFSLVAAHRATLYPHLSDLPADLMLSGHIHGGLVRLPKVGGLIDVDGTFFPDYDKGFYSEGEMDMFVSTGCNFNLGKLRLFNPPMVSVLTLKR